MFGLFNRAPVNVILRGIKDGSLVVKQEPVNDIKGWSMAAYSITRKMPDGDVVIRIHRSVETHCDFDSPEIRYISPDWMTFRESQKIFNTCIDHQNDYIKARQKRERLELVEQLTRKIPNV